MLLLALLFCSAVVEAARRTNYMQFSYSNCGSSSDPIQVSNAAVSPSPVVFGSNITASATVSFAKTVTNSTAGSLTFSVQKHIGFIWVDIPCSKIPGGCSYPNFCEVSQKPMDPKTCALLKSLGLPCGCPIPAGTYSINNLNEGPVPSPPSGLDWLVDGSFKIKLQLNDASGNRMLCAEIVDSVK